MKNKSSLILSLLSIVVAFIFFLSAFYRPLEIEDNWWHLACGRWIVENLRFPTVDIFAFDDTLRLPWINLQWLGQVVFYAVYAVFTEKGLIIFRALIFTSILGILFVRYHKKVSLPLILAVLFILSYFLEERLFLRPMMFNALFSLFYLLCLIDFLKADKSFKQLMVIPLTGIIWYNINGGAFVYGSLILVVFIVYVGIRWLSDLRAETGKIQFVQLCLLGALFLASFLFNPYGWNGFTHYFLTILNPWAQGHVRSSYIQEEQPGLAFLLHPPLWLGVMLIFTVYALWRNKKPVRILHGLLFLSAGALFIFKFRAIDLLGVVCAVIILESFALKPIKFSSRFINSAILGTLIVVFSVKSFLSWSETALVGNKEILFKNLKYYPYPEWSETTAFIKNSSLKGNMFNSEGLGGYFLWDGYPDIRPVKDGRNINDHVIEFSKKDDKFFGLWYPKVMFLPELFWEPFTSHYVVNSAVLVYFKGTKKLAQYLNNHPQWKLVNVSGRFMVFVRQSAYPLLSGNINAPKLVHPRDVEALQELIAIKNKTPLWEKIFTQRVAYDQNLSEGITLINLGYKSAAFEKFRGYYNDPRTKALPDDFNGKLIRTLEY